MNNPRPYVGITGFTMASELDRLRYELEASPLLSDRRLMVGVLVSRKSLDGEPLRPEWAARYPKPVFIEGFIWGNGDNDPEPNLLKTLHFNSHDPDLFGQLIELVGTAPSVEAIQLNMAAPPAADVKLFAEEYLDEVRLILQVGPGVLAGFNGDPSGLARHLEPYGGFVSHALIDSSGGVGRPLEVEATRRLLDAVDWDDLGIMPGVAGGLCVENVQELTPLLEAYPNLSWDAEGKMMGKDGRLDMRHCRDYLAASADLLAKFA